MCILFVNEKRSSRSKECFAGQKGWNETSVPPAKKIIAVDIYFIQIGQWEQVLPLIGDPPIDDLLDCLKMIRLKF